MGAGIGLDYLVCWSVTTTAWQCTCSCVKFYIGFLSAHCVCERCQCREGKRHKVPLNSLDTRSITLGTIEDTDTDMYLHLPRLGCWLCRDCRAAAIEGDKSLGGLPCRSVAIWTKLSTAILPEIEYVTHCYYHVVCPVCIIYIAIDTVITRDLRIIQRALYHMQTRK